MITTTTTTLEELEPISAVQNQGDLVPGQLDLNGQVPPPYLEIIIGKSSPESNLIYDFIALQIA